MLLIAVICIARYLTDKVELQDNVQRTKHTHENLRIELTSRKAQCSIKNINITFAKTTTQVNEWAYTVKSKHQQGVPRERGTHHAAADTPSITSTAKRRGQGVKVSAHFAARATKRAVDRVTPISPFRKLVTHHKEASGGTQSSL